MNSAPGAAIAHPVRFGVSIAAGIVAGRIAVDALEPAVGYWPGLLIGVAAAVLAAALVQKLGRRASAPQ